MKYSLRFLLALIVVAATAGPARSQDEITLQPSQDNTLIESATGSLSNGAGDYMFAGRTGQGTDYRRRGLVQFDVAGNIPAGSVIQSVELTMQVSKTLSGTREIDLHRITSGWGEGTSNAAGEEGGGAASTANDATWVHTFFPSSTWLNPGGDFDTAISATMSVGGVRSYTWGSTNALVADVQAWLDNPSSNHGWIIIGDEGAAGSAKRFDTREGPVPPQLRIQYQSSGVAIEESSEIPSAVSLMSTYPNPFTRSTTIEFEVSEPGQVTLEVYDTLGRRVTTLAEGWHGAGRYEATFTADDLPAGVYFFRLAAGSISTYRQAVLMR